MGRGVEGVRPTACDYVHLRFLPADKGGATVVLDTEEYKEKATQQLSDATTYKALTSDPTPMQSRAIQKTLDRLVLARLYSTGLLSCTG